MTNKEVTIEVPLEENPKGSKKKEKKDAVPMVGIMEVFKFATDVDILLMMIGTVGAIGQGAVMPGFSLIYGLMLDALNEPGVNFLDKISEIAVYFVYAGIGAFVVTTAQNVGWSVTAARQVKRIREEYLKAIMRQEIGWFDETPTGELVTRISGDTVVIHEAIGDKVATFIQFSFTTIFGFALGFVRGWKLTLVMIALTPLMAISGAIMMKVMSSLTEQGQSAYGAAGAFATEVISGIRTIAAFASEPTAGKKYRSHLVAARKFGIRSGFASGLGVGFMLLVMYGVYALALWYGSELIIKKEMTGGDVMTVFFSVIMGAFALGQAMPPLEAFSKGRGACAKIYDTIARKPRIDSVSGKTLDNVKGTITLKNIFFAYPTRQEAQVLNDFSLTIEAGKKVALVGHSGCGKSSTISLIQRFYDPEDGKVKLDGHNIKRLNLTWLRQQMGLVSQEPVLFSGSIADNIRYGKQDASIEEVQSAAKAANAHNFIVLFPEGYDTQVGEKGAQLSGGQKQRIAIARAIIKNPKILLLDEATSALDSESEKVVQDALDSVMKGRTTIIIAHRLSTIKDADQIVVLNEGKVAEQGTHDELMQKNGLYFDLVKAQTGSDDSSQKEKKKFDVRRTADKKSNDKEEEDELKKKEEEEKIENVPLKRILALNKPEGVYIFFGCIAAAAGGVSWPVFSILFSEMVNLFYAPPSRIKAEAYLWSIGFAACGLALLIILIVQTGFFAVAGQWLTQRLRDLSFSAIIRNDVGWFDMKENRTGVLTSRLATEATLVEGIVGTRLGMMVQNISTVISGLVIAFYYGWKLTLVTLSVSPLIGFANAMETISMKGITNKLRKAMEQANQVATEAIFNIRTIASFTQESMIVESYTTKYVAKIMAVLMLQRMEGPAASLYKSEMISALLKGSAQFFMMSSYALTLWYGGKLIGDGEMNFLNVTKVLMAVIMLAMGVGQTSAMAPDAKKAQRAAAVIFKLIDRKSPIDPMSTEGKTPSEIESYVDFKGVSFNYPTRPEVPILKNFNLQIKEGQVVALVGHSGCGKSSTVALLERFYDPQDGQISIGGVDIKALNVRWLRQNIGHVGQEPVLFSGTIADNIRYGKEDATDEEVENAAKAANAHNFITEFPAGYKTEVGEKGAQLSGGQKQRIAIARAIIKNPKVLLLDEATSALDAESEKIVQGALDSVMKGRTTIIIAHRLSTIRNADVICVISGGKIEEQGNHDELMKKNGAYKKLVERQTM